MTTLTRVEFPYVEYSSSVDKYIKDSYPEGPVRAHLLDLHRCTKTLRDYWFSKSPKLVSVKAIHELNTATNSVIDGLKKFDDAKDVALAISAYCTLHAIRPEVLQKKIKAPTDELDAARDIVVRCWTWLGDRFSYERMAEKLPTVRDSIDRINTLVLHQYKVLVQE